MAVRLLARIQFWHCLIKDSWSFTLYLNQTDRPGYRCSHLDFCTNRQGWWVPSSTPCLTHNCRSVCGSGAVAKLADDTMVTDTYWWTGMSQPCRQEVDRLALRLRWEQPAAWDSRVPLFFLSHHSDHPDQWQPTTFSLEFRSNTTLHLSEPDSWTSPG